MKFYNEGEDVAASDATEVSDLNSDETLVEDQPLVEDESTDTQDETEVEMVPKSELEKAQTLANNYKIRAEKAERKPKEKQTESQPGESLSTKDLYALMEAKVPQEDIDEVVDYARLKKIPVAEALKTSVVKGILSDKAEQRTSANAAHSGTSKRTSSRVSDETLLANAAKGILPENDEDIARLIAAQAKAK